MGTKLSKKDGASESSKPSEKRSSQIKTTEEEEEAPVWDREAKKKSVLQVKLPHNYGAIIQDADSPVDMSSIDKLYDQLCAGVFLNQNTKYWVEKDSGSNSFTLFARDMSITWIDDRRYWKWSPVKETSDVMVDAAELIDVCWLEVRAKFDTKKLSPGITYEVAFAVMLKEESDGWEAPVSLEMQLENGIKQQRRENFVTKPRNRWIEISVGEFITAPENDGEMRISVAEHKSGQWKRGLIIKAILIQPKI